MKYTIAQQDPAIRNVVPEFDFANPPIDPVQFALDLAETMVENNGVGLAANQLGLPYRVFAIGSNPVIVAYNPIVVDYSTEQVYLDEGCLSFKNLFVKVKRPTLIKVRYTEPNGNVVTTKFSGMTARIYLHELDHLEGITMIQRANPAHLASARAKQKQLDRRGVIR